MKIYRKEKKYLKSWTIFRWDRKHSKDIVCVARRIKPWTFTHFRQWLQDLIKEFSMFLNWTLHSICQLLSKNWNICEKMSNLISRYFANDGEILSIVYFDSPGWRLWFLSFSVHKREGFFLICSSRIQWNSFVLSKTKKGTSLKSKEGKGWAILFMCRNYILSPSETCYIGRGMSLRQNWGAVLKLSLWPCLLKDILTYFLK